MASRACWLFVLLASSWCRAEVVRGVALGLFSEDPGWSYRPLLAEIAATGANQVALVIGWYQPDASSTEVSDHPRFTAPAATIAAAVRDARALGLEVTLFPIVRLQAPKGPDEWRGTLRPRDRAAWWRSYGDKLLELARLGQTTGARALSVGSELSTLDGARDRAAWEALLRTIRRSYSGQLSYSANWDHFGEVHIYDLVDLIGLCGYFRLVEPGQPPTLDRLVDGWRRWRSDLERFVASAGRPIVLTEIGYRSIRGAAAAPWDEGSPGAVDLEEQRRCYAAFRRVWQDAGEELLAGVYFWNWYGWGGASSQGYTPRGKPALEELRALFAIQRDAAGRAWQCR